MTTEKIRAEIEMRLIPENECKGLCPTDKGRQYAYREVLYIIDSMQQKEPVHCTGIGKPKEPEGVLGEMIEEEALEAEINRWYDDEASKEFEQVLWADTCNCARHFAAWQREQMMKWAVEGYIKRNKYTKRNVLHFSGIAVDIPCVQQFNDKDRVKLLIIKQD